MWIIRSEPTHAITLECTKCCCGPRTSHNELSGCRQTFSRYSVSRVCSVQASSSLASPASARAVQAVEELSVDVELELPGRLVADPNGS